jgi:hypothetical protein
MTNQEIVNFIESSKLLKDLKGIKISYFVARNFNLLKAPYKEFLDNKKALQESYVKKDKEGNPVLENNKYIFEDAEEFQKEFTKLLEEEVDIKPYKINLEDIPEDISVLQMGVISEFIDEQKEVKPIKPAKAK